MVFIPIDAEVKDENSTAAEVTTAAEELTTELIATVAPPASDSDVTAAHPADSSSELDSSNALPVADADVATSKSDESGQSPDTPVTSQPSSMASSAEPDVAATADGATAAAETEASEAAVAAAGPRIRMQSPNQQPAGVDSNSVYALPDGVTKTYVKYSMIHEWQNFCDQEWFTDQ